ncbi:MAG: hypothetical protein HY291_09560 [Planctomycetes bacterium]|nr:hypothetical protein [Planctomycetota bacterium]
MKSKIRFVGLTVLLAALACVSRARAAEALSSVEFDAQGLKSLKAGTTELLKEAKPSVVQVVLETAGNDEQGFKKYSFEKAQGAPDKVSFDAAKKCWAASFAWGGVDVLYQPKPDRLDISVTLRNTSANTLADFEINLVEIQWPAVPISMDPPFYFGLKKSGKPTETLCVLKGGVYAPETGAYIIEPHGLPRVAPGKSLTMDVTFRIAAKDAKEWDVLADAYEKFRTVCAPSNTWEDRRIIGAIMRSSSYKDHKSATNPRGWFNNPKLDVTTPDGKKAFKEEALKDAARCVKSLKAVDAQGMVFWDVEGSENPHPITYIGDPRLAKKLAPEFDEVADDYFKVFLDAGLCTGVCIRPTQVYFDEAKKAWSHGTGSDGGPGRGDSYPQLRAKDVPWWRYFPIAERISDKIAYAKKRWGCTIFYIDTNGTFQPVGEDQKFDWTLLNSAIWKAVKQKNPDVLLIPELPWDNYAYHAAQWAYCAQYMELRGGGYGTPEYISKLFPGAFSLVVVSDGDFTKHRDELKASVQRGDILMVQGWFGAPRNAEAKALLDEVRGKGKTAEAPPAEKK